MEHSSTTSSDASRSLLSRLRVKSGLRLFLSSALISPRRRILERLSKICAGVVYDTSRERN
jgi:hypothetical protein